MMKKVLKLALLAVAAAFLATALPACSNESSSDGDSDTTAVKKSRRMTLNVSNCDVAESITAETKLNDDFSVLANDSNAVSIDVYSMQFDGPSYTKRLKLGGAGDTTKRSVKFAPDGTAEIRIEASIIGEPNDWKIILEESKSGELQEFPGKGDTHIVIETLYFGAGETLYLYSNSGSLNIYAIYVNGLFTSNPYTSHLM